MSLPTKTPDGRPRWYGKIPNHWKVGRTKVLFSNRRERKREGDEQLSATQKFGVIPQRMFMEKEDTRVMLALSGTENFKHVDQDDFVISLRSFEGGIERCFYDGCVSPAYTVMTPNVDLKSSYFQYVFKSREFIREMQLGVYGIRDGKAVNFEDVARIVMPQPPTHEQSEIASYLDVETARIDALIQAKLDLKIKLEGFARSTFLAEVLDCAKALPGTAVDRMQWLPTVPSAWTRCKVKHLVEHFDQGVSPQCESRPPSKDEWGVLKAGCINSGSFDPLESKALPPEIASIPEVTVSKGDLIISRANTQSLVGRSAVAQKDYPKLMLSDKLYRLKLDRSRCVPEFIRRTLWIPAVRQRIEERATGASPSMLNIDRRTILEIDVVLPPVPEQLRLLEIVDRRADGIAELIGHVDRELELLRDLRSSTITDAVLGRIDVRPIVQNKNELEAA